MENTVIAVRANEDSADFVFDVTVDEYKYKVRFSDGYYNRLTGEKISPQELVEKSFAFLLEREAPEAIMRQFELPVISRYFPEYEQFIADIS